MRSLLMLLPLGLLLSACSSNPSPSKSDAGQHLVEDKIALASFNLSEQPQGDFADNPAMIEFVDKMVEKHDFDRRQLYGLFAEAKLLENVVQLMDKQAPAPKPASTSSTTTATNTVTSNVIVVPKPNGSWIRYRNKFITPSNIEKGIAFWNQYEAELQQAYKQYGVPPEIIVGIIGVETGWGRVMGKTRILDALTTLSFGYPRRAEYFSGELETFLLMLRDEGVDPLELRGSFAGAMGYGQFMPSAFKSYAVDFSGDGHVNLWDPVDAIGSVANYFKAHGWTSHDLVAVPAAGQASLKAGFNTDYKITELAKAGLKPHASLKNHSQASLLRMDMGDEHQYWYGLPNFYVITRYNHSSHYAMAVWQLGEEVGLTRKGSGASR